MTENQQKLSNKEALDAANAEVSKIKEKISILDNYMAEYNTASPAEVMTIVDKIRDYYYSVSQTLPKYTSLYKSIYAEHESTLKSQVKKDKDSDSKSPETYAYKNLPKLTMKDWEENRRQHYGDHELLSEVDAVAFPFFQDFLIQHARLNEYVVRCISDLTDMYNSAAAATEPDFFNRIGIPMNVQEVMAKTLLPRLEVVHQTVMTLHELSNNCEEFGDIIIWRFLTHQSS